MAQLGNLTKRVLSAIILLPIVLLIFYFGSYWLDALIIVVAFLGLMELWKMCRGRALLCVLGSIYLLMGFGSFLYLAQDNQAGQQIRFWILSLVVFADSGAYFAGRMLGGPKLMPSVSPNKTWAGLIGAVIGATLAGWGCLQFFSTPIIAGLAISAGLGIVEQLGDLLESGIKRYCGVKDSGWIIPGHGGVLDRLDGALAVSLAMMAMDVGVGGDWVWLWH